jgi:HEAT repeat protein
VVTDDSQPVAVLIDDLARGLPDMDPDDGLSRLIVALSEHPNPDVREAAAYGLRDYEMHTGRKAGSIQPLLAILGNMAEDARIRGTAAETLGVILSSADRRRKVFRQAARVLVDALHDPAPEVRFWAAYALGEMQSRVALDELRRVADSDQAMCPGWWLVRDEASGAIDRIQGQPWPERVPERV